MVFGAAGTVEGQADATMKRGCDKDGLSVHGNSYCIG